MINNLDIVTRLQVAANTIFDVDPVERQRLLTIGINEVASLRGIAPLSGDQVQEQPDFMDDMPHLVEMAGSVDAVEVLIAAGMSMLAGEIERLKELTDSKAQTTLGDALGDAGFAPCHRNRIVVGQGRKSTLRRG